MYLCVFQQEDNPNSRIRATRNIASAGPHRVVEPHTIQAIKGSNVIAQTSNLPSIPIMQGQSSLGAVRGINVRETVIRQREIHPGAHREALVRQLARLRSAIHGVHYGYEFLPFCLCERSYKSCAQFFVHTLND